MGALVRCRQETSATCCELILRRSLSRGIALEPPRWCKLPAGLSQPGSIELRVRARGHNLDPSAFQTRKSFLCDFEARPRHASCEKLLNQTRWRRALHPRAKAKRIVIASRRTNQRIMRCSVINPENLHAFRGDRGSAPVSSQGARLEIVPHLHGIGTACQRSADTTQRLGLRSASLRGVEALGANDKH